MLISVFILFSYYFCLFYQLSSYLLTTYIYYLVQLFSAIYAEELNRIFYVLVVAHYQSPKAFVQGNPWGLIKHRLYTTDSFESNGVKALIACSKFLWLAEGRVLLKEFVV